jgi:lysophospholipase L1-like esterase
LIGAILAAALTMQAINPVERPALENPQTLRAAGQVLNDPDRTRPFSILVLGDSHSAADHISGALRERLQARYGASGRGVLQPGSPFAGHSTRQLSIEGLTPARNDDGDQAPGVGGFIARPPSGSTMRISAEPAAAFDTLTACFLAEPGAGDLLIEIAGRTRMIWANSADRAPRCEALSVEGAHTQASIQVTGSVRLFSMAATRTAGGGVSVSNLGVIGAQVRSLLSRDSRVLAAELEAYAPDLILLAFGTNEGFDDDLDAAEYGATYREALELLRRLAPDAAVVAVGPPDAATLRPDLYRQGGFDRYDLCFPLSEAERADYASMVAVRDDILARWYAPPSLSIVREIQRAAADQAGVAFWDWEARMGGPCSVDRMLRADPPAARSDHVHFNTVGGAMIGGWLADDLMAAMSGERD